jgi:hypothetical protein
MRLNRIVMLGLVTLVVGCATKQPTAMYWTREKAGVVTVHHVVGTVDHAEKLTQKPLSADQASAYKLAEKGKYFGVTAHDEPFEPATPKPKKDVRKDPEPTKLAEVTAQLHDLKRQISAVSAQNQRLQEQINTSASQQSAEHPQETAQEEANAPRVSQ